VAVKRPQVYASAAAVDEDRSSYVTALLRIFLGFFFKACGRERTDASRFDEVENPFCSSFLPNLVLSG
jgi:hypothetical protein